MDHPLFLNTNFSRDINISYEPMAWGDTLRISEWGCAAGTLEPLTYTTASSAEFCYPIQELTPQIPPILE